MMNDQKLEKYFNFDEADLNANRNGRFSEKQLNQLKAETKSYQSPITWGTAILFFLIAAAGMFGGAMGIFKGTSMIERISFGVLLGLLWPYFWVKIGLDLIKPSDSPQKFDLNTVQGRVNIVAHEDAKGYVNHELHVGETIFDVNDDIGDVMIQGREYAVYFLDDMEQILSVELISKTK